MLRHIFVTLLSISVTLGAVGQTFDVKPGQLAAEKVVPSHGATITVTGAVDASDLDYLVSVIEDVRTLDLSGADIAAYKGAKVGVNTFSSPANTLPAYLLAGLKVAHVQLPRTLTSIGEGALMGAHIEEIEVPAGVTSIGSDAFGHCKSLTSAILPEGVSVVAARTFEGCESLASVTLPEGLANIGARAFLGCRELQRLALPASVVTIGDEAFALSGLESIMLDGCQGLTSVGRRAFASCTHLATAILPSGATVLGEGVFSECQSLATVQLPSDAVSLPALAFKGDANISDITLPDGLTSIGTLAMAGMSGVESVELPRSLSQIDDGAFEGWTGVRNIDAVKLPSVPQLGEDVWAGVEQSKVNLDVAPGLEDAFMAAPQWQEFTIGKSSITGVPALADAQSGVEAYFLDRTLVVNASEPLGSVTLYAVDGRVLATVNGIDGTNARIDTSHHAGAFFIARVATMAGRVATFKLMRQL